MWCALLYISCGGATATACSLHQDRAESVAKKRQLWPRRVRRVVQTVAFLLFLVFIARMPALALSQWRGDWLMRLSPLSGLGASISAWQLMGSFWPAAVLLVAALVLGRFFCGWLCPLGATLDIADSLIARFRGKESRRHQADDVGPAKDDGPKFEHLAGRRFKYYLLVASLLGAFLGISFFGLLDALSIAVRSYVLVIHSYVAHALVATFGALGWAAGSAAVRQALLVHTDPVFQLHVLTLVVLLCLLGLGLLRRRFWCRYLCPLGALYALAAKPAVTKRSVSEACIECGRCADACPLGCISRDGHQTLNGECTLCLHCQAVCPVQAVSFFGATPAEQKREVDLTRRGIVASVAAGAVAYPVLRIRPAWEHAKGDPLIRPPLAGRDLDVFLSKCLRCGQCMRACPNQAIQPAGLEAGIESLWTPKLSPRPGYCEYNCDVCAQVCPSGAIPPFTLAEKHETAMGLAFLDTTRCIPWRGDQRCDEAGFVADEHNCGVCEEVCPVPGKAIQFRHVYVEGQELRLPYVREEVCVGCGYCEAVCPLRGKAAIRVTGGFRELAPALAPEPAGPPLTEQALPTESGSLRIAGEKVTYEGPDELFDYINGGADPYLTFGFIRVTMAKYTDGASQVKADLWEFETSDDAFGAFAKDRQGEPLAVGDEGSMLGSYLWARRGRFMVCVLDMTETPPEQVRLLATAALEALEALGEGPAARPEICRRLPTDGLAAASVVFMRDEMALFDLRLAEDFIPDGIFGIADGAVAAYGIYDLAGAGGNPAGLLLVEHASATRAREAVSRLAEVRSGWGEEPVSGQPLDAFKGADGSYCVMGSEGRHFAAVFFMPSPEAGVALIAGALQ